MAFVAAHPEAYIGTTVGSGQCVDYVRAAANVPHTSEWIEGEAVWETPVARGTAIATFNAYGKYANATDGSSHAAIFLELNEDGSITVYDQWSLHPVAKRIIRAKAGSGLACDDADAYCVIES